VHDVPVGFASNKIGLAETRTIRAPRLLCCLHPSWSNRSSKIYASFCNDDSLPPVAQAAIAHAQFETIHPFTDGNERVGRALIHMIFRRRALIHRVSPPVSLILATRAQDYVNGLTSTRYVAAPDSQEAVAATNQWIGSFSVACERAARDAIAFKFKFKNFRTVGASVWDRCVRMPLPCGCSRSYRVPRSSP